MIPLSQYAKVNNKYCICYFGPSPDNFKHLIIARPFIEKELPGIEIYLVCRDSLLYLAENETKIISQSNLVKKKWQFGYVRELKSNFVNNPVTGLLAESKLIQSLQYFLEAIK